MNKLQQILQKHRHEFADVLPYEWQHGKAYVMDLSVDSTEYAGIDPTHTDALIQRTKDVMQANHAVIAIGRYAENRTIYQRSEIFCEHGINTRTFHIGMDLSAPAGTTIFAPLDARVHSFQNNKDYGDYGPTIILQHELDGLTFFTLYGHLSLESLSDLSMNQLIKKGEPLATMGDETVNGGWPPHLHFQIIDDMQDNVGDFPGVVAVKHRDEFLRRCPDPNLILNIFNP